jgi:hypothetical protein
MRRGDISRALTHGVHYLLYKPRLEGFQSAIAGRGSLGIVNPDASVGDWALMYINNNPIARQVAKRVVDPEGKIREWQLVSMPGIRISNVPRPLAAGLNQQSRREHGLPSTVIAANTRVRGRP